MNNLYEREEMDSELQYSNNYLYNQPFSDQYIYDDDMINNKLLNSYPFSLNIQEQQNNNYDLNSRDISVKTNKSYVDSNRDLVQYNYENLNKQKAIVINIPSQKYIFLQREFLINGDIYLNFDEYEFNRIGQINKFKKMQMVNYDKQIDQLSTQMSTYQYGVDEFKYLIDFCLRQPSQRMQQIAQQLILHQQRVQKIKQFSKQISIFPNISQFVDACENCYQNFKVKCQAKLQEMIKNCCVKFYKAKFVKIDYLKGTYEFESMAMSQVLLALLGITTEQAKQFILRKGMFEFVFSIDEFNCELLVLNLYLEEQQLFQAELNLKTFDGIDLYCKVNFHLFYNRENSIALKTGLNVTEFFIIVDYDITPNMLRKVIEIRQNDPNKLNMNFLENEQDWDYSAQSKQFIQQFYPTQV